MPIEVGILLLSIILIIIALSLRPERFRALRDGEAFSVEAVRPVLEAVFVPLTRRPERALNA